MGLPLSAVCDLFARHLLQADLEAVPADLDVLLLHLLLCFCSDIVRDRVCDVANSAEGADDDEEDNQANEILELGHDCTDGGVTEANM
jgi:hypothetical protein